MTKAISGTKRNSHYTRSSSLSDIERFSEIEKLCFSQEFRYGFSILFNLVKTALDNTALTYLLNDFIIGFIVGEIDQISSKLARIVTIQVDPNYQRQNVGTYLLTTLENILKNNYGISTIELQVYFKNSNAIHFYQKNGYNIAKQLNNYYSRQEHAFLMKKNII